MELESGLVGVGLMNFKFSVANVSVQCGTHHAFPKIVNTFVHERYRMEIPLEYGIHFLIVDAKA